MPAPNAADHQRLVAAGNDALSRTKKQPLVAADSFTDSIMDDPLLLHALLYGHRGEVRLVALGYLEKLVVDPVHVRQHERAAPGKSPSPRLKGRAPKSRIGRVAAKAVARSIYDREIGSGKTKVGELTKYMIRQIKRRGVIDTTITDGLLGYDWPDEDKTTVQQLIPESDVRTLFERAYQVLENMGMSAPPTS